MPRLLKYAIQGTHRLKGNEALLRNINPAAFQAQQKRNAQ
ncbi:MAG: hypothetical protein JETT_1351 [Candidatus Jettenia ecosi]|uniref:Uncharacterized protein n=1 Tax=Candidatus Jettenia ecosi TaxID=2494326 RepID=A0A533QCX1_9BACT|nr:MAG: hypothetical protein JETT_1351 [Candidatus Jettenia ecosi]